MLYCREEKALFSNKKAGLSLRSYLHQRRVCLLLRGGQCRGAAHALPLRAAAESFLHQHRPHGRGVSLPLRHAAERLLALPSYRTARQRRRLSNESTVEHTGQRHCLTGDVDIRQPDVEARECLPQIAVRRAACGPHGKGTVFIATNGNGNTQGKAASSSRTAREMQGKRSISPLAGRGEIDIRPGE